MLILVIDLVNKKYEVHILVIALFKISQLFMDTLLNVLHLAQKCLYISQINNKRISINHVLIYTAQEKALWVH